MNAKKWLDEWFPINGTCKRKEGGKWIDKWHPSEKEWENYKKETNLEVESLSDWKHLYSNYGKRRAEITHLDISQEELAGSLDLSNFVQLTLLNCHLNQLTSLDVSNNTQLTRLNCGKNQLTSLDVSNNVQLTRLVCYYNQLKSLDLNVLKQLIFLNCHLNQLTSLNLERNIQLTRLSCDNNQLTSLDVNVLKKLEILTCSSNQLTSLNIEKNIQLTVLDCSWNQLTSLNVENNIQLTKLDCSHNQLTSLNVEKNIQLTGLWCHDNNLTTLILQNSTELKIINCSWNLLTSLDLSNNIQLAWLACENNQQLTQLNLSNNENLTEFYCYYNSSLDVELNSLPITLTKLVCFGTKLANKLPSYQIPRYENRAFLLRVNRAQHLSTKNEQLTLRVSLLESLLKESNWKIEAINKAIDDYRSKSLKPEEDKSFSLLLASHKEYCQAKQKMDGIEMTNLEEKLIKLKIKLGAKLGREFIDTANFILSKLEELYTLERDNNLQREEKDFIEEFRHNQLLQAIEDLKNKTTSRERIIEINNSVLLNPIISRGNLSIEGNYQPSIHNQGLIATSAKIAGNFTVSHNEMTVARKTQLVANIQAREE
jgi:Leucine-rich repeat (LRR) protein